MAAETEIRVTVKIPAELKKDLKISAAHNERTLGAEITHWLQAGLERQAKEAGAQK